MLFLVLFIANQNYIYSLSSYKILIKKELRKMSNKYEDDFSEGEFIKLIRKVAGIVPFSKDALSMYYCFRDEETPLWVKTSIVGALGYFICPIDAIPDAIPIVGWLDDAGVISAA